MNCEGKHRRYSLLLLALFINHILAFNFKWEAGLDRHTGLAHSYERSSVLRLRTVEGNEDRSVQLDISKRAKDLFTAYPQFLGERKVLLGALVATPAKDDFGSSVTHITDFLLGLKLLTFGKPTTAICRTKIGHRIQNEVVTEVPVIGGLLACCSRNENMPSKSYGILQFKLVQTCNLGDVSKEASLQSKDVSAELDEMLRLETRVIDYQPKLAGNPPVSKIRASFYSSTQRILHAYVMQRFHGHCYKKL